MKIHHLFVDKKGESHFEDMEIPYVETSRAGRLSARLPATGIIFREVQPDYDLDWHPAPRRQYIINLDAGVQITASDGEIAAHRRRRGHPGRGHLGQGPPLQGPGRQAPPLHLRSDRVDGGLGPRL